MADFFGTLVTIPSMPNPTGLDITSSNIHGGRVGVPYSGFIRATGGTAPYSYSQIGQAPGLMLNSTTGEVTGTPTAAGSYGVLYIAFDSIGSATNRLFTYGIAPHLP